MMKKTGITLPGDPCDYYEYEVETAGLGSGQYRDMMIFDPTPCSYGRIEDGIMLGIDQVGGNWIISYEDLLEMARIAREVRSEVLADDS
jgi:hypothetical protein